MNRRTALVAAVLSLVAATVSACGSTPPDPAATHVMADGETMSGSSMPAASGGGSVRKGPSEAAAMVCGDEIRTAVAHTLQLGRAPQGLRSFDHGRFRCSYLLSAGELRLTVEDLDTAGRAYFEGLRARLPHATDLHGVESLGFPSFETPAGDVVFLKDHKTLRVDASRLSGTGLPSGMSRTDVAYGIAAAVIACWSE